MWWTKKKIRKEKQKKEKKPRKYFLVGVGGKLQIMSRDEIEEHQRLFHNF